MECVREFPFFCFLFFGGGRGEDFRSAFDGLAEKEQGWKDGRMRRQNCVRGGWNDRHGWLVREGVCGTSEGL